MMIEQRLIDANKLSQEMCQRFPFPNGAVADDVMAIIDNAPTVDVVPVVRGKWVDIGTISCRCSVCRELSSAYTSNYCPNCGAKMEGEE